MSLLKFIRELRFRLALSLLGSAYRRRRKLSSFERKFGPCLAPTLASITSEIEAFYGLATIATKEVLRGVILHGHQPEPLTFMPRMKYILIQHIE